MPCVLQCAAVWGKGVRREKKGRERRGKRDHLHFERQVGGDGRGCKDLCEAVTFGALKRKGQSWTSGKRKDNLGIDAYG